MKKLMRKIFLLTVLMAALIFSKANAAWQPEIRIGILRGVNSVNLQMSAPCNIVDADTQKIIRAVDAGENFTIYFDEMTANALEIRGGYDLQTAINGKKYFGGVRINKNNNSLNVISLAPVEEYLRGVVPEEMGVYFSTEALKAQAVAARSFTLKNRNRHESEGFDLCATNHCQFYGGVESAKNLTDKIILETRGEIVTDGKRVVDTNFHTDSGGMTENVADVWGSAAPHLLPAVELETKTQPWTVEISAKDFSAKLDINELKSIKLSKLEIGKAAVDRSKSGRVKFALIIGTKKNLQISGNDLRTKFSLPSTLFDMKFDGDKIIFSGYGRGHGVGMSQRGAEAYAKIGWSYDKILAHYYRGTTLKKLY